MYSTCSHVNWKDHECSKHVKGVEPKVTGYRDPHIYDACKNQQEETTLLAHYSFIHSTNIYQTPTMCHTPQAMHCSFEQVKQIRPVFMELAFYWETDC